MNFNIPNGYSNVAITLLRCIQRVHSNVSVFYRKNFQSLEQLSQTSLEPSHTLNLDTRPASSHWHHHGVCVHFCALPHYQ